MRHPAVKYRTICPDCASVFRVGPEQLEAAGGWVQCGVCGAPFEAWPTLLQEDGSVLDFPAEPPPRSIPAPGPSLPAEPAATAAEVPFPAAGAAEAQSSESPAANAAPATTADFVGIAGRERAEDLTSIILVDPDQPADDDFGPLPVMSPPPPMPPAYPPIGEPAPTSATQPETLSPPATREAADTGLATEVDPAPATRRRDPGWGWTMASVVLLATLLAQATFFLRDILAAEVPQTRPALERACMLLGCTLELPRQIGQLRIVGSDLQNETTEHLRLTLTLGNRSAQAQAWPVLVLTLTGRQDKPLARRSFAPSEYLGDPVRIAAGIPPRSEHALDLPLRVRDLSPMGFVLHLTY